MAAVPPYTHHEILALVAPFSRQGRQVDLAASQRAERRIAFKPVQHPGIAPGGGDVVEILQLENTRQGRYRLTRTLSLPGGLQAQLHTDGPEPAALLAALSTVPLQRQFFETAGCTVVLEQLLTLRSDAQALPPEQRLALSHARCTVAGLQLTLRVPAVTGVPADLKLQAETGDPIELPDDLLAVLGWPWSRLQRVPQGWTGVLRLSGKDDTSRGASVFTRSADAQSRLRSTIEHLARTLAEPPARFHQRLWRQRWGVTLRRAFPLLAGVAMLAGAAALPKIDLAEDSVLRMLIFHAPPLLLVAFFCLREMPRIEIPPRPRASRAAHWRISEGPSPDGRVSDSGAPTPPLPSVVSPDPTACKPTR